MFKKVNADIMLVIVAVIWGTGFIMTEYAINSGLSPIMIMAGRFGVATLTLLFFVAKDLKKVTKKEWMRGSLAGVFLFLGFLFQTIGQSQTTVTNAAFLTAINVVIVPFLAWGLTRKKPKTRIFLLAVMTFIGVTILTVSPENGSALNIGDLFVLICAFMFALHISYLSIAVDGNNPLVITFIQMTVSVLLSVTGLIMSGIANGLSNGGITLASMTEAMINTDVIDSISSMNISQGLTSVVYLGLFSTCLCFFMQTSAQARTTPAKTGIILSTESLFGTLFSVMLGIDPLTAKIIIGGAVIMTAVILTEVDFGKKETASSLSS